jgi:plasmid stabilization system protein ParE
MRLRFTPLALADIEEIAGYLHARSPAAAKQVRQAIPLPDLLQRRSEHGRNHRPWSQAPGSDN